MRKLLFIIPFIFAAAALAAQNTTIQKKKPDAREAAKAHKVMLIPFEPKLYMSEIDRAINAETGLKAKEIRHKFRDGINEQLYKAFKTAQYGVVDLMDDTTKYKKETDFIYQYLSYQYQKVPNQENYKAPVKEKESKTIQKGQLTVETNSDARFMNAKLSSPKVVPQLYGKYKTDVFVFINQLDIKSPLNSTDVNGNNSVNRRITVHYTVYTFDAKEINSGIAEAEFDVEINSPKKIIEKYFSQIAFTIVQRVNKGLGII